MASATTDNGTGNVDVETPSRDEFGWADYTDTYGPLSFIPAETSSGRIRLSSTTGNRGKSSLPTECVGLVVDGVDAYKNEYADTVFTIPAYFSRFEEEFDTYLGAASVSSTYSHAYGAGINPERLEQAIRIATGGGRFSASEITVTACGDNPFIVETDAHTFIVSLRNIKREPEQHNPEITTINGIDVVDEMSDTIQHGISRFIDVLSAEFGITVTGYSHRTTGSHVFTTDSTEYETLAVGWQELELLTNLRTRDEIVGEHEYEHYIPLYDAEYSIQDDDVPYTVGEEVDVFGTCIGYKIDVLDKGRGGVQIRPQTVHASLGNRFSTSTHNGSTVVDN